MSATAPADSVPFPLPEKLDRDLARVQSYWDGLRRAGNEMPFWDDLKLAALTDQADKLLLIDVFAKPERFRFNHVAEALTRTHGEPLTHKFADEIDLRHPFAYLRAQCSATVEAAAPTYYRCGASGTSPAYARLLLPMWGNGRIGMLLGAVDRQ